MNFKLRGSLLERVNAASQGQKAAVILVLGPARSGKSEWAEQLATQSGQAVIYIATARRDPTDPDWQTRIQQHCDRRPPAWTTLEVPEQLAATVQAASPSSCLLIDSLGTWVANLLGQPDPDWQETVQTLIASLQTQQPEAGQVIIVAEETGWGVIPAYPTGRLFRDRLGTLIRHLGAIANTVYLVTGGHVLNLSQLGMPLPLEFKP